MCQKFLQKAFKKLLQKFFQNFKNNIYSIFFHQNSFKKIIKNFFKNPLKNFIKNPIRNFFSKILYKNYQKFLQRGFLQKVDFSVIWRNFHFRKFHFFHQILQYTVSLPSAAVNFSPNKRGNRRIPIIFFIKISKIKFLKCIFFSSIKSLNWVAQLFVLDQHFWCYISYQW